jgi:hypothetical protein
MQACALQVSCGLSEIFIYLPVSPYSNSDRKTSTDTQHLLVQHKSIRARGAVTASPRQEKAGEVVIAVRPIRKVSL